MELWVALAIFFVILVSVLIENLEEKENKMLKDNKCKTCKHHDSFSWVCSNPDSSYVADFTDEEDWCSHYEEAEDEE